MSTPTSSNNIPSTRISLESKESLPLKLQDVVCDASLLVQHIQSASSSNELLGNAAKTFAAHENTIECTAEAIGRLHNLVDDMCESFPKPQELCAQNE